MRYSNNLRKFAKWSQKTFGAVAKGCPLTQHGIAYYYLFQANLIWHDSTFNFSYVSSKCLLDFYVFFKLSYMKKS